MQQDQEPDYKSLRAAIIEREGLTLKAVFVPFSRSRNAGEKHPSLNWKITLQRKERDVITTDYMQGIAHIPKYDQQAKHTRTIPGYAKYAGRYGDYLDTVAETGKVYGKVTRDNKTGEIKSTVYHKWNERLGDVTFPVHNVALPPPDIESLLYSLIMDGGVLNYASFEDWAKEYGYDPDSRKGEQSYNDCMKIALQLRAGLGESVMSELAEAFTDY